MRVPGPLSSSSTRDSVGVIRARRIVRAKPGARAMRPRIARAAAAPGSLTWNRTVLIRRTGSNLRAKREREKTEIPPTDS